MKRSTGFLIGAVCLSVACILNCIALGRYLTRLPDDFVGVGLYVAVIVLSATAALGFYLVWMRERRKEAPR